MCYYEEVKAKRKDHLEARRPLSFQIPFNAASIHEAIDLYFPGNKKGGKFFW